MERVAISPVRVMSIFQFGFVLGGAMTIFVAIMIPAQTQSPVSPIVEGIITILALVAVFLGFRMPGIMRLLATRAREAQRESDALNEWLKNNLIGLVWIFSCNLFALVLHFLGGETGLVELLFAAGIFSLVLWRAEAPPVVD